MKGRQNRWAIIFDLDGTLVDSIPQIAEAVNRALSQEGWSTHPHSAYRGWIGGGLPLLVERAMQAAHSINQRPLNHNSAFSREALATIQRQSAHYYRRQAVESAPYPAVEELLSQLQQMNIWCSVLTNKPQSIARRMVAQIFLHHRFRAVIGSHRHQLPKPHSPALEQLLRRQRLLASQALMVGDSPIDWQSAQQAGLSFVGVDWGYGRTKGRRISHPLELVTIIKALQKRSGI